MTIVHIPDVCCNCRSPRYELEHAKKHYSNSSSIAVLCKDYKESHSLFQARNSLAASSCDVLSSRNYDNNHKFYYSLNGFIRNERFLSTSSVLQADQKPSSKVERTVTALKEKAKQQDQLSNESIVVEVTPQKSLKQKIIDECVHYYHGFRLLFIDINVSAKLLIRILRGKQLTRREHNLVSC